MGFSAASCFESFNTENTAPLRGLGVGAFPALEDTENHVVRSASRSAEAVARYKEAEVCIDEIFSKGCRLAPSACG